MNTKHLSRAIDYPNLQNSLHTNGIQLSPNPIIEKYPTSDLAQETVAILVENKQKQLLLVQTTHALADFLGWEIPTGHLEPGEDITTAARQIAWQLTGYDTADPHHIYSYNLMGDTPPKVSHIAKAQSTRITGTFNRDEIDAMQWFSRADIQHMLDSGIIKDGVTLAALLLYLNRAY